LYPPNRFPRPAATTIAQFCIPFHFNQEMEKVNIIHTSVPSTAPLIKGLDIRDIMDII
jgi:hypothetical protein